MKVNSIDVFVKYIMLDYTGQIDASGVFSKQCFKHWMLTRKTVPKDPAHAFRKVLTGHVRGDKGLQPFQPLVEAAVLKVLREKKIWNCFEGTGLRIGLRGYQTKGYWEKQTIGKRSRQPETPLLTTEAKRARTTIVGSPPISPPLQPDYNWYSATAATYPPLPLQLNSNFACGNLYAYQQNNVQHLMQVFRNVAYRNFE